MVDKDRLTVGVSRGAIFIRLPLSILPVVFQGAPFNERGSGSCEPRSRVTDVKAFAAAVVEELDREEENGATLVHHLFDRAMEEAVENGCEGIDDIPSEEAPCG